MEAQDTHHPSPRVSVVLIFLNGEKYLREAIDSVLGQTYDDWELLLADDGSTDGSTELARGYAQRWGPKISYLEHEGHRNLGMSATRNLGLGRASGEYVAFIDADDVWLPQKLAEQVEVLDAHADAAMVYGRDLYWHSWNVSPGGPHPRDHLPTLGVPAGRVIQPPTLLPRFLLGSAAVPCPTGIMVRRAAIERVGGFEAHFRGAYMVYEDQVFYSKLLLNEAVIAVDACWDRYRQHPEASCAVDEQLGLSGETRQYFLSWLESYLRDRRVRDEGVWKALRQAQWLLRHPRVARLARFARRRLGGPALLLRDD